LFSDDENAIEKIKRGIAESGFPFELHATGACASLERLIPDELPQVPDVVSICEVTIFVKLEGICCCDSMCDCASDDSPSSSQNLIQC